MKKQLRHNPRLALGKETVRALGETALSAAVGGANPSDKCTTVTKGCLSWPTEEL